MRKSPLRLTEQQAIKRAKQHGFTLIKGTFKGTQKKADFICPTCHKVFTTYYNNVGGGKIRQCAKCANVARFTTEEQNKRLRELGLAEIVSKNEYTSRQEKTMFMCKSCGKPFKCTVNSVMQNSITKCSYCRNTNIRYDNETIRERLSEFGCMQLAPGEVFHGTQERHRFICKRCKKETVAILENVLRRRSSRCGACAMKDKESHGVKLAKEILDQFREDNVTYEQEYRFDDCKDKYTLPFDFIVLFYNMKILVEIDGGQHRHLDRWNKTKEDRERALIGVKRRDKIKDLYCKDNGIHLLRVKYNSVLGVRRRENFRKRLIYGLRIITSNYDTKGFPYVFKV